MNKCFSDYELTCRVENELRNTSESNTGDLWKMLNKFKRSKREDKIDIDELYEYLKNLNLSNEVGIPILKCQIPMIILQTIL